MTTTVEVPIPGKTVTTVVANLRQGAPNTLAPVLRILDAGTPVSVVALVVGEAVRGNAHWYRTAEGSYLWAGACGPFQQSSSSPPPAASTESDWESKVSRTPWVIDMSHGDGVLSFAAAKNAGLLGVIHKATTGATGRDDAYADRRITATQSGLLWGAYHWGTAAPIEKQVQNFLGATGIDRTDATTLMALDFEKDIGNQMTLQGARDFCQQIFDQVGRRPMIYSGNVIKAALGNAVDPFFGAHRLWLAEYGNAPVVQRSWSRFWLWQYTDGEKGPGVKMMPGIPGDSKGRLDCDYFDGSTAELAAQWAS